MYVAFHPYVQAKSYARHGQMDENDKGYVSIMYNTAMHWTIDHMIKRKSCSPELQLMAFTTKPTEILVTLWSICCSECSIMHGQMSYSKIYGSPQWSMISI